MLPFLSLNPITTGSIGSPGLAARLEAKRRDMTGWGSTEMMRCFYGFESGGSRKTKDDIRANIDKNRIVFGQVLKRRALFQVKKLRRE